MGRAAYRRGSDAVRRHLDAAARSPYFRLMEDLNAWPRHEDAGTPLAPVRLIYDATHKVWWIQDAVKGDEGWGSCYPTLRTLIEHWHITITGIDLTTGIWQAIPTPQPPRESFEALYARAFHPRTRWA